MTDETTHALLPVRANDGHLTLALIDSMNAAAEEPDAPEWASRVIRELADRGFVFARLAHSLPSQADETSGEEMRLREALERIANDLYQHGQRVQKMKAIARAALSSAIGEPYEFSGWVEVVDEGESGNDAIAAIGGDRG